MRSVGIDIVDGFVPGLRLAKEYPTRTGEDFGIVIVGGDELDNAISQTRLAAQPWEW